MEIQEPEEKCLSIVIGGNRLEIITWKISDGEWALCIENCFGVRTEWFERFNSPDAALEEGRKAIMEEGVDEFVSMEGFEYLTRDPCVH